MFGRSVSAHLRYSGVPFGFLNGLRVAMMVLFVSCAVVVSLLLFPVVSPAGSRAVGATGEGLTCSVVVAGDSITARSASELHAALGEGACTYGRPGQTSKTIVDGFLGKPELVAADTWVIAAGSNDALRPDAVAMVGRSMLRIEEEAVKRGARVFWVDTYVDRYSALPMSRKVNTKIASVAASSGGRVRVVKWAAFLDANGVRPLSYLVDGVHTTPEGSRVRSQIIANAVNGRSQVLGVGGLPRVVFSMSPRSGRYGTRAVANVRVSGIVDGLPGYRVVIAQPGDTRETVQWVTLNAGGSWSGVVPLRGSGNLKVFVPGSLVYGDAVASKSVKVSPALSARVVRKVKGVYVVSSGGPSSVGKMVLQKRVSGGWVVKAVSRAGVTAMWKVAPSSAYRVKMGGLTSPVLFS